MSEIRMMRESAKPPRKPQATPRAVPVMVMIATSARVENTLVLRPIKILEKRSRP